MRTPKVGSIVREKATVGPSMLVTMIVGGTAYCQFWDETNELCVANHPVQDLEVLS